MGIICSTMTSSAVSVGKKKKNSDVWHSLAGGGWHGNITWTHMCSIMRCISRSRSSSLCCVAAKQRGDDGIAWQPARSALLHSFRTTLFHCSHIICASVDQATALRQGIAQRAGQAAQPKLSLSWRDGSPSKIIMKKRSDGEQNAAWRIKNK